MAVLAGRVLKGELVDLNETRKTVENAENRARQERNSEAKSCRRELAQALHREADRLHHSGDYESALVLYHRAANLFPRDSSHSVAARRTTATISSCNNPSKALRRVLSNARTDERLTVTLCPETAVLQANDKLKKSPDPSTVVEALGYFDDHKRFWKTVPSPRPSSVQLARSKTMLRQLNNLANAYLDNLKSCFESGKMAASLKIAQELLVLSEGLQDPSRYQIGSYHYLSLIHVSLGRHDRAAWNVSRLVRLSKSTGDVVQFCRALVTLGKVHLSFGHLHAAARAWEHLARGLREPIPVAWIRHEIGRCYLETGRHGLALEMATRCIEAASKGNSEKWMLHGRLLLGQLTRKVQKKSLGCIQDLSFNVIGARGDIKLYKGSANVPKTDPSSLHQGSGGGPSFFRA
ncbi:outer dynein arm-docking complex subunit 4-like [Colletes gigas]|uniref:outer dynein arm-docking complex subunit 4-like n=1 Tax=Colletes gigas TaxID=935657 RepID=UPI001C9BB953|nr:outer dynein arm-docking complex subunit 4-like [Colletes gigas]